MNSEGIFSSQRKFSNKEFLLISGVEKKSRISVTTGKMHGSFVIIVDLGDYVFSRTCRL